jgi:hypothetical protein
MKKPKGKIDWRIAEDDESWQAIQGDLPQEGLVGDKAVVKAVGRRELLLTMLVVVLLLFCVAGGLWQQHGAVEQASQQRQRAAVAEAQTLTATLELLDESMKVSKIQRQNTLVMAQVIVNYPEEGAMRAYREMRFFEKSADQWRRIDPVPTLLGPQKTLRIAHFVIHFAAVDANIVYATAPNLERLYAKFAGDFGLPVLDATSPYSVELATTGAHPSFNRVVSGRSIVVTSPSLLSSPVEISEEELLYQSLIYPLASQVVDEIVESYDAEWQSRFSRRTQLPRALALWELWGEQGALADGRVEVVQWLFRDAQEGAQGPLLPDHYERLCRTFHIWGMLPWDVSIPLACTASDKQRFVDTVHFSTLPESVQAQLYRGQEKGLFAGVFDDIGQCETLIEYVAANYGREKLPLFIAALGEHDSTESLIPALFGVAPAEFQAGWHAYVEQRYHVE